MTGVQCQVCGFSATPTEEGELDAWATSVLANAQDRVEFHVCPTCAQLDPGTILDRRGERIRKGLDAKFH